MTRKTFKQLLKNIPLFTNDGGYGKNYVLQLLKEVRESTIKECANVATTKLTSTSIVADKNIILQLDKNSIKIYEI